MGKGKAPGNATNMYDPGYKVKLRTLRQERKNKQISSALSGERPKVTLPKFSWDKENDKI